AAAAGDGERQEQDGGSHPSSMLRFRAPRRAIVSRFLLAGGGDVTRGFGLGLLACLLTTVVARPASAAPPAYVIAEYCNEFDVECTFAPIEYDKTVTLPIAFDWDTGWIPQGSDLQVRFYVKLPATTRVKLGGELETTWPTAMTLATPG